MEQITLPDSDDLKQHERSVTDWAREHAPAHPTRFDFWYKGVLRLCLGIAQIVAVIWCFALFLIQGVNAKTMQVAFIGIGLTTASLLLYRIFSRSR